MGREACAPLRSWETPIPFLIVLVGGGTKTLSGLVLKGDNGLELVGIWTLPPHEGFGGKRFKTVGAQKLTLFFAPMGVGRRMFLGPAGRWALLRGRWALLMALVLPCSHGGIGLHHASSHVAGCYFPASHSA